MNRFLRPLFLSVVLFAAGLWSGSAQAAPPSLPPTWATWQLDTGFLAGQVKAKWVITVGGVDANGAEVELVSASYPVACWVVGQVAVGNGTADFAGGYVECSLPSFAQAANDLIEQTWGPGHGLALSDLCECRPQQERRVEGLVLPTAPGGQPVFHHPSLQFAVPGEGSFFANSLEASGQSSTGPAAKITGLTRAGTDHLCSPFGSCKFVHYRDGQVMDVDTQNFIAGAVYTGKTSVYLGYDPDSGARFVGQMGSVHVDPGCRMD